MENDKKDVFLESLRKIWDAFNGANIILTGYRSCANNLGVSNAGTEIEDGHGPVVMVRSTVAVTGTVEKPDEGFRHMTKLASSGEDECTELQPGTLYRIHVDKDARLSVRRSQGKVISLNEAFEKYVFHTFDSPPLSGHVWSCKKGVLTGLRCISNISRLCKNAHVVTSKCHNEDCTNNDHKRISYFAVLLRAPRHH